MINLIGDKKKYIVYTVVFMILKQIAAIAITAGVCGSLYIIYKKYDAINFVYTFLAVAIGIIVRFFSGKNVGRLKDILGREVKKELRSKVYSKIADLGVKQAEGMNMAGLTQVSMEGIEQLDLYYSTYLPQFFFSMIAPFVLFAVCAVFDWRTGLVLLACVPLIPISIVAVSRYAKKLFDKYWGKYMLMGDEFLDSVQGLKELKIFNADEKCQKDMNENAEDFRKITMKVLTMQLFSTTIMDIVAFGGAGAGVAMAITDTLNNLINPIQALFLILIAAEFFLPLRALGSAFHVAMNGVSAGKKILKLLDAPELEWGDKKVTGTNMEIENLSFSYDKKREILKNINMKFPELGMTAIVGESGSGKSTIVNLLTGALRADTGVIKIGGIPIEKLSREDYYSSLALVSSNSYVFNDTVRNNFRLVNKDITDEQAYNALKKADMYDFIENNGGLDKMINEDAANISGGQKQRLYLATALAADKKIYIFDEATSNIDIESEAVIMQVIKHLSEKASVVVISHRLSVITAADNIYYLKDGIVEEEGSHEKLLEKAGGYARIYHMQKHLEEGYLKESETEVKND